MNFSEFHSAEFQQFVQDHLQEDPAHLLLKYQGKVAFDLKNAVQQISTRQKASKKLPSWASRPDLIFPASISLEQSSSEETAKFKAQGLQGKKMIDLTGGFGVDYHQLSLGFEAGVYCEQQTELFQLASHNLELLNPEKTEFFEGNGLEYLEKSSSHFDLIYADPARRGTGNQKLYKIRDCQPDLVSAWDLLREKSARILIKLSPMLDISQAWSELPEIQKIKVISVKNEVKELLLYWEKGKEDNLRTIEVVDLESNFPEFSFEIGEEEKANSQFGEAGKYLIEPISGIMKAGAFKLFGERFDLRKLEKNTHLYSTDTLPESIPGRVFEVVQEVSPKKNEIKSFFPSAKVNVLCRNYVTGAEELKKKFGLKDGGDDFLIGTKSQSGVKVFWCKRVQ
jgi:hypothetical protein